MPVAARKEYVGVPRDRVENFHGKQLVFVSWDHHLLIAAPIMFCLPPQASFGELIPQTQGCHGVSQKEVQ